MPILLSYAEVEQLLSMAECIDVLEDAYRQQSQGLAVCRPRSNSYLPTGEPETYYMLKSMEGALAGSGYAAIRLSSEVVQYCDVDGVPRRERIPTAGGDRWLELVLLFDTRRGDLLAIMPGGWIQGLRVAATSALGARYMARPGARVLGLYGTGWQARAQVLAHTIVRPLEKIRVFSPNPEHRRNFAREMSEQVGISIEPVDTPEAVMRGADMVATATNANLPVILGERLEPGMWFTCVKNEVDLEAVRRSDVIAVHQRWGSLNYWPSKYLDPDSPPPNPNFLEYRIPIYGTSQLQLAELPDLSDLITGRVAGRTREDQITFFYTNPGWGIQFAATAGLIYEKARRAGLGRELPLDWFLQHVHP